MLAKGHARSRLRKFGLYGLLAYHVAHRTGEIGIRMALGETRQGIAAPILREALLLASLSVAVSLPVTVGLTRFIRSSLYGVKPFDPTTICCIIVLLLAVSELAAWIPARRASRVDPTVAPQPS